MVNQKIIFLSVLALKTDGPLLWKNTFKPLWPLNNEQLLFLCHKIKVPVLRLNMKLAKNKNIKLLAQKAISIIPGDTGFKLNEYIVGLVRGKVTNRTDFPERVKKGLTNLKTLDTFTGFNCHGKTIIELGTGWHCIDPLLFFLLGAKQVYTVDHHLHANVAGVKEIYAQIIKPPIRSIISESGLYKDSALLEERFEIVSKAVEKEHEDIHAFFSELSIKFLLRKSAIVKPDDIDGNIDLLYSESVIQRIKTADLEEAIKRISTKLSSRASSFHRTDQKDINTQDHVDKDSWGLEYLKYSDFTYSLLMSRFNYQNRLRESDFIKIFETNNLKTVHKKSIFDDADIARFAQIKLPKRFKDYSLEDLATKASIIVSQKD